MALAGRYPIEVDNQLAAYARDTQVSFDRTTKQHKFADGTTDVSAGTRVAKVQITFSTPEEKARVFELIDSPGDHSCKVTTGGASWLLIGCKVGNASFSSDQDGTADTQLELVAGKYRRVR
jgi:hypothetical protein